MQLSASVPVSVFGYSGRSHSCQALKIRSKIGAAPETTSGCDLDYGNIISAQQFFAFSIRISIRYLMGVTPSSFLNIRLKLEDDM